MVVFSDVELTVVPGGATVLSISIQHTRLPGVVVRELQDLPTVSPPQQAGEPLMPDAWVVAVAACRLSIETCEPAESLAVSSCLRRKLAAGLDTPASIAVRPHFRFCWRKLGLWALEVCHN